MDAKRIVRWTWLPVLAVVLYTTVVMTSRWRENRALEDQTRQRQAETDRTIVERYGDGNLKLLTFYANPPHISAGEKSLLCYGVANASAITIEPAVEGVGPSLSRCVEVRPAKTTTYTLTAHASSGEKNSNAVTVTVR